MRANVGILTAKAKDSVSQSVTAYQNAAAAHVSGDWGVHNQLLCTATAYSEPVSGHTVTGAYALRVQLSGTDADGLGDSAFIVPAIDTGEVITLGSPPYIILPPTAVSAETGTLVTFVVSAASDSLIAYQWNKDGAAIAGANQTTLVLASIADTDAGDYTVTVSNAFGDTTSAAATLTVISV